MLGVVGVLQPLVHAADGKHADEKTGDVDGEATPVFEDDAALDGCAVAQHPQVAHLLGSRCVTTTWAVT